jgi:hypothetical protein
MVCDVRRMAARDRRVLQSKYRVIADGRDLTAGCFYVDARRRIVGLYTQRDGQSIVGADGELIRKWLYPRRVRLVPPDVQPATSRSVNAPTW